MIAELNVADYEQGEVWGFGKEYVNIATILFLCTVGALVLTITIRYLLILRFYVTIPAQFEGYWFLLMQGDMVSKDPSTRYQALKDQREELLSSLYYDNPLKVALDLRATTYLDWVANPVFWEEINSLVPINMVKFMTNLNKEGM